MNMLNIEIIGCFGIIFTARPNNGRSVVKEHHTPGSHKLYTQLLAGKYREIK